MAETTRLALPRIDAAQSQKHVTHNEALAILDACVQLSLVARDVRSPPADAVAGATYLVGNGATESFSGHDGEIAIFDDGFWRFVTPRVGWRAYLESDEGMILFDGESWSALSAGGSGGTLQFQDVPLLGLGTRADAANPLSAKLNSLLFTALEEGASGTGDLRMVLNKSSAGSILSQIYQSNYSGRAETGLVGDDRFRIKVSADGQVWRDALHVDPGTGRVNFPAGLNDLSPDDPLTGGDPWAYRLAGRQSAVADRAMFWIVPHAPNATALGVDPTLQIDGVDAAPIPLRNYDGGLLPQGRLETGRAVLLRRDGARYLVQPRNTESSWINLLEDGGRFAGNPEMANPVINSYIAPLYFGAFNGATLSLSTQVKGNSSTFGGTGNAMAPSSAELVAKIRTGSALLNGTEFYICQVTAGSGTLSGATFQGVPHYSVFSNARVTGRGVTSSIYVHVTSGSVVFDPGETCPRVLVDGLRQDHLVDAAERLMTPDMGWRHIQRWVASADGSASPFWPFRATPGATFLVALPAIVIGLETLPWDIGAIPSARIWR